MPPRRQLRRRGRSAKTNDEESDPPTEEGEGSTSDMETDGDTHSLQSEANSEDASLSTVKAEAEADKSLEEVADVEEDSGSMDTSLTEPVTGGSVKQSEEETMSIELTVTVDEKTDTGNKAADDEKEAAAWGKKEAASVVVMEDVTTPVTVFTDQKPHSDGSDKKTMSIVAPVEVSKVQQKDHSKGGDNSMLVEDDKPDTSTTVITPAVLAEGQTTVGNETQPEDGDNKSVLNTEPTEKSDCKTEVAGKLQAEIFKDDDAMLVEVDEQKVSGTVKDEVELAVSVNETATTEMDTEQILSDSTSATKVDNSDEKAQPSTDAPASVNTLESSGISTTAITSASETEFKKPYPVPRAASQDWNGVSTTKKQQDMTNEKQDVTSNEEVMQTSSEGQQKAVQEQQEGKTKPEEVDQDKNKEKKGKNPFEVEVEGYPFVPKSFSKLKQLTVNIGPLRQQDLMSQELHDVLTLNDDFNINFELKEKKASGRATKKEKCGFVKIPFKLKSPYILIRVAEKLGSLKIDGRDMSVKFPEVFNVCLKDCKEYMNDMKQHHAEKRKKKKEKKERQIIIHDVPQNVTEEVLNAIFPDALAVYITKYRAKDKTEKVQSVTIEYPTKEDCLKRIASKKDVKILDRKVILKHHGVTPGELVDRQIVISRAPDNVTEDSVKEIFPEAEAIRFHRFGKDGKLKTVNVEFLTKEECLKCYKSKKDVKIMDKHVILQYHGVIPGSKSQKRKRNNTPGGNASAYGRYGSANARGRATFGSGALRNSSARARTGLLGAGHQARGVGNVFGRGSRGIGRFSGQGLGRTVVQGVGRAVGKTSGSSPGQASNATARSRGTGGSGNKQNKNRSNRANRGMNSSSPGNLSSLFQQDVNSGNSQFGMQNLTMFIPGTAQTGMGQQSRSNWNQLSSSTNRDSRPKWGQKKGQNVSPSRGQFGQSRSLNQSPGRQQSPAQQQSPARNQSPARRQKSPAQWQAERRQKGNDKEEDPIALMQYLKTRLEKMEEKMNSERHEPDHDQGRSRKLEWAADKRSKEEDMHQRDQPPTSRWGENLGGRNTDEERWRSKWDDRGDESRRSQFSRGQERMNQNAGTSIGAGQRGKKRKSTGGIQHDGAKRQYSDTGAFDQRNIAGQQSVYTSQTAQPYNQSQYSQYGYDNSTSQQQSYNMQDMSSYGYTGLGAMQIGSSTGYGYYSQGSGSGYSQGGGTGYSQGSGGTGYSQGSRWN